MKHTPSLEISENLLIRKKKSYQYGSEASYYPLSLQLKLVSLLKNLNISKKTNKLTIVNSHVNQEKNVHLVFIIIYYNSKSLKNQSNLIIR